MIAGMLVWELVSPTIERRGFLKIPTTGDALFCRFAGHRLYPSGLARAHGFEFVVCDAHFSRLDIYRHALGIKTATQALPLFGTTAHKRFHPS
jgi:hypothetical protein